MSQIADGTVKFTVRDSRLNSLLEILYPVGSIKITVSSTAPFSDLGFGTWEEVSKGRVLWGADDSHAAGSTIEAGLPNITGMAEDHCLTNSEKDGDKRYSGGALSWELAEHIIGNSDGVSSPKNFGLHFDASRRNSIYGSSDTVTPPLTSFISGNGLPKEHKNIRQYHIGKVV